MSKAIKVLQFTDTHLYKDSTHRMRGVDTYDTFKQAVDLALEKEGKPDFVVLTGDISMDETAESYDRVREIVEPIGVPIYFLPGNHDCFNTMWMRFVDHKDKTNIRSDRSFTHDGWLIVLLDSVLPMKVEGRLSDEELARLDSELSAHAELSALVCLHHNPLPFAHNQEDDMGLKNATALFRVIDKHKNVKAVLWGHVHSEHNASRNGVDLLASPSTCIQFKATEDGFVVDNKPPGYRLLMLEPNGKITSRVGWLAKAAEGLESGVVD